MDKKYSMLSITLTVIGLSLMIQILNPFLPYMTTIDSFFYGSAIYGVGLFFACVSFFKEESGLLMYLSFGSILLAICIITIVMNPNLLPYKL